MPILDCSVNKCVYNKEDYCCRGNITVGGEEANKSESTCCSSFQEQREGSFSNRNQNYSPKINVACDAKNCVFNESKKCSADHIGISGSSAHAVEETECSSFRCQ